MYRSIIVPPTQKRNGILQGKQKPLTEARATEALQEFCFLGQKRRFLGWQLPEMFVQRDGSLKVMGKPSPRCWSVPEDRKWWSPLLNHLRGSYRGVVATEDSGCTSVPFIALDPDRHHGEDPHLHITNVMRLGRECQKLFPQLKWLVEVNLNNGSTKFFGFWHRPIPIERARVMASQLYERAKEICGNPKIETFPHNCQQVMLPCRTDKITIIDCGELPKCERYKMGSEGREYYTTYSMVELSNWIKEGTNYHEMALLRVLKDVCHLDVVKATKPAPLPKVDSEKPSFEGPRIVTASLEDIRQIGCGFTRKRVFVQWLSRQLKRVPTLQEALESYRANEIYNGDWETGLSQRIQDFRRVLSFVEQTFSLKLCGEGKSQRPELNEKIRVWQGRARIQFIIDREFATTINQQRFVDEYGVVQLTAGKKRIVHGIHLPIVMAIIDQVRKADGGIPRDSIKGWWDDLAEEGLLPKWNPDYWLACRQVLEQIGWLKMSHEYSRSNHTAKTCRIIYGNGPLVGTRWVYPKEKEHPPTPLIMVVTQSARSKTQSWGDLAPRPPP